MNTITFSSGAGSHSKPLSFRLPANAQIQPSSQEPVGVVAWPGFGIYLFVDLKKDRNPHIFTLLRRGPSGEQGAVILATDEYHQFLKAFNAHKAKVE